MLRLGAPAKLLVALMLLSISITVASAQTIVNRQDSQPKEQTSKTSASEASPSDPSANRSAKEPRTDDLQTTVDNLKAENAEVRELLRKMEEQQKTLLEQMDRLQRRMDGSATADVSTSDQANAVTANAPLASPESANSTTKSPEEANAVRQPQTVNQNKDDHYQDGIIIWQNPEDAKVPFLLKFTNNTQVRYLNTLSANETFTDHLGVVRTVNRRNDITVNRSMFVFAGYVFDKRAQYSLTVWTSAGAASIVVAGNIGWRFNKRLTLTGGYTGVPGSRSLVNTFPFFASTDRTMADNFFRPAFTQGVWANGELFKNVHYLAFVGNGLNTLNISATKIDTHLLLSGSTWWEPLGPYSEPGRSRNMYDDYFSQKKVRIRLGTSFTRSREDRFSNLDQSQPDNTSLHNSDGVLTFSTGAFAPGVTVDKATYRMWAIDGGLKKSGFSVNGQYFFRWLNDFEADGPLPLASTFDHGFELSTGKFVLPKKLLLYVRGSKVFGQFANPYEYGGGFKWYFLPTERLWMTGELMRVNKAPYGGAFTPYTAGMAGWTPMLQTVLAF